MRLPQMLLAACLVCSSPLQPAGTQNDPISGTWKGDMAPKGAANRRSITTELKFDGARAVTGSVTGGATFAIKTGTFDPKTGALRLEVETKDTTPGSLFIFDGMVVQDTAIGHVTGDNQTGDFKLTKLGAAGAGSASSVVDATADLRRSFTLASSWVRKAADLVAADKYAYRPVPSVRTFGQVIAHIADSYDFNCGRAAGRNVQWSDVIERGPQDKATLLTRLNQAGEICTASYVAGEPAPLIENLAHTNLHYGNLVTYLRMLGLTPPSN